MPLYEYRCLSCGRVSSVLVRSYSATVTPSCRHCGGADLRKLVSRFAVLRSEESRLDELADPSNFGDLDENDPKSVARWARRMGKALGEDLGDDFDEMCERMEAGEMPDEETPESVSTGDID